MRTTVISRVAKYFIPCTTRVVSKLPRNFTCEDDALDVGRYQKVVGHFVIGV
jgi:hypothetical protein